MFSDGQKYLCATCVEGNCSFSPHCEHLAGGLERIAGLTSCLVIDGSAHKEDFLEKSVGEEEVSR